MSENDWSLKGKERMVSDDVIMPPFQQYIPGKPVPKFELEEWFDTPAYKASDVEILRQKIIEDICLFCKEHYWEYDTSILELTLIINKRFGIKK